MSLTLCIVTFLPAKFTIKYACASPLRYASYLLSIAHSSKLDALHTLSRESALRLTVYNALLDSASTNNDLHMLQVSCAMER
ncbi:hypothetical protein EDB89DRAFT_2046640, partial [Lactarius sanguifluus]